MTSRPTCQAVLFDLDGTLVDSAPDLGDAANELRQRHGLAPLDLSVFRPMTGTGARGMVAVALDVGADDPRFKPLRDEYLALYEARMTERTRVFASMAPVLDALDAAGLPWGIVTNKFTRYAEPVVRACGIAERSRTLVCGDTTAHAKPHPEPLFEAARRLSVEPGACVYVGDDHRDILAGRAAGMSTLAAAWGYLGIGEQINDWGADVVIDHPNGLLKFLAMT